MASVTQTTNGMEQTEFYRPVWSEIDLGAIAFNMQQFRRLYPQKQLMAVVKADAYGHGAVPVAKTVLAAGADWLGVAFVEEGLALRQAGIEAPILVLGTTREAAAITAAVRAGLALTVYDRENLMQMAKLARQAGRRLTVHVKVDTGMNRIGVKGVDAAVELLQAAAEQPWIEVQGMYTHFATADEADKRFTRRQYDTFMDIASTLERHGLRPPLLHCANSAAAIELPETAADMLRIGIGLYGVYPSPEVSHTRIQLKPAMQWKTRVAMVKPVSPGETVSYGATYRVQTTEWIATLPLGYADGYSRRLSNVGEVLIRGHRCPVVGRVCMDQFMVRVPDGAGIQAGDEVVLFGRQDGAELPVEQMAAWLDTIAYEVLCMVGKRVPRVYR
ncbi:MAG: alanine racemase [Bacillota bacterium]